MDLSFRLPAAAVDAAAAAEAALPAGDMALLLAMLAERQATSATAHVQAALADPAGEASSVSVLAPVHGAFNAPMAARLRGWQRE